MTTYLVLLLTITVVQIVTEQNVKQYASQFVTQN